MSSAWKWRIRVFIDSMAHGGVGPFDAAGLDSLDAVEFNDAIGLRLRGGCIGCGR